MKIEPIKPLVGARIHMDRAEAADPAVARACREALDQYGVLVFPQLNLTDEEQLAFTDLLGGRMDYSSKVDGGKAGTQAVYTVTLNPELNSQKEYVTGTFFWHIDGLHRDSRDLPKATCLTARRVAPKGGNTSFANLYAAYEALSDSEKADIEGLGVEHNLVTYLSSIVDDPTEEELARWGSSPTNVWPLVWHHESGRTSMILGRTATRVVGMELAPGLAIVERLQEWAAQPDFVYEHEWQEGDMVIWDNHGVMHRTTVAGQEFVPEAARVPEPA